MLQAAQDMLPPPKPPKPKMVNTGFSAPEALLEKLEEIARDTPGVKSRNVLMASMLAFDVELFPHIQRLGPALKEIQDELGLSQVQVIVRLLEQGLSARKKK